MSLRNFRVVGGGLAGLGVTYHLLREATAPIRLDVIDPSAVGRGGASAVAGGLVHPLSPRGKLVHWGLEGLATTNQLLEEARRFHSEAVLREELYRIATDTKQCETLRETARRYPELATWLSPSDLLKSLRMEESPIVMREETILGGIRLSNGCKVIHVPSYLEGLWNACVHLAETKDSELQWVRDEGRFVENESVTSIYCTGASSCLDINLPVQLVRGHSVELKGSVPHAILSGKYVSPMANGRGTLIGATHEFNLDKELTREAILQELQQRTSHMCRWDATHVDRITSGVRVQSNRGAFGRRPIVGQVGKGSWIFSGLSSRGLLYHGLYGKKLAKAIWSDNEDLLLNDCPDILWWK